MTTTPEYIERIYAELRQLAAQRIERESHDESLSPTALIHEVYLRIQKVEQITDTNHFRALAAQAMQRILVDRARKRRALKRGGTKERVPMQDIETTYHQPEQLLAIHELLDALHVRSPRRAELVRLRVFGGYKLADAAEILGISLTAAEDDWAFAIAWLRREWNAGNQKEG